MVTYQPPITVHMAFAASPTDVMSGASVTWTDITRYVRWGDGVSFQRGRTTHNAAVSAGQGGFNVNNSDARFTPGDTTYGTDAITLRRPVQIRWGPVYDTDEAYDADELYDDAGATLWTGSVDDYQVEWRGGIQAVVTVNATDLVAHMARKQMEALPVQVPLAYGNVAWCYPLDEDSDKTVASDRSGNPLAPTLPSVPVGSGGSFEFGAGFSPGSVENAAETTVGVFQPSDATNGAYLHQTGLPAFADADNGSTVHFQILPTTTARTQTAVRLYVSSSSYITVGLNSSAKLVLTTSQGSATGTTTIGTTEWTHVTVRQWEDSGTIYCRAYVNGSSEATVSWTAGTEDGSQFIGTGNCQLTIGSGSATGADLWDGNVCNVTAHTTDIGETKISEIGASYNGWAGDGAVTRLYRAARAAGLSASTDTGGQTTLNASFTKGKTLQQVCNEIAENEVAPWWLDGAGQIRMEARTDRQSATSDFTLIGTDVERDTRFTLSDELLINKVTASRVGGAGDLTRKDDASIAMYGEYEQSLSLAVEDDDALELIASAVATRDATPQPRSGSIATDVVTRNATIDVEAVVGADVGTRFTVNTLPSTAPESSVDFFVEGVADQITRQGWRRTFNTSRGEREDYFTLDSSDLDSEDRLAF